MNKNTNLYWGRCPGKEKKYLIKSKNNEESREKFFCYLFTDLALKNVPESVPEFCSICLRKMSFVPENLPESPRMAPEKYGMYVYLYAPEMEFGNM